MSPAQLVTAAALCREITQHIESYRAEATRQEVTRAFLETHAARLLKRAAELYALSRQVDDARPVTAPPGAVFAAVYTRDDCPFKYCDTAPPHTACRPRCRHAAGGPDAA